MHYFERFLQQISLLRLLCLRVSIPHFLNTLLLMAISTSHAFAGEVKEPATQLALKDALALALNANPEIAVALREREAIDGIKTQAALRPNPSISTMVQDTR